MHIDAEFVHRSHPRIDAQPLACMYRGAGALVVANEPQMALAVDDPIPSWRTRGVDLLWRTGDTRDVFSSGSTYAQFCSVSSMCVPASGINKVPRVL